MVKRPTVRIQGFCLTRSLPRLKLGTPTSENSPAQTHGIFLLVCPATLSYQNTTKQHVCGFKHQYNDVGILAVLEGKTNVRERSLGTDGDREAVSTPGGDTGNRETGDVAVPGAVERVGDEVIDSGPVQSGRRDIRPMEAVSKQDLRGGAGDDLVGRRGDDREGDNDVGNRRTDGPDVPSDNVLQLDVTEEQQKVLEQEGTAFAEYKPKYVRFKNTK